VKQKDNSSNMPKITLQELCDNVHNWLNDNNALGRAGRGVPVKPKVAPQFIALLEECDDELMTSVDPDIKKLRVAISTFCEKIVSSKSIDVGVRARAGKFIMSMPDHEPRWNDVVAREEDEGDNEIPEWDDHEH